MIPRDKTDSLMCFDFLVGLTGVIGKQTMKQIRWLLAVSSFPHYSLTFSSFDVSNIPDKMLLLYSLPHTKAEILTALVNFL